MEGQFNGGFFALRVWGPYIWRGLFLEFYSIFLVAGWFISQASFKRRKALVLVTRLLAQWLFSQDSRGQRQLLDDTTCKDVLFHW